VTRNVRPLLMDAKLAQEIATRVHKASSACESSLRTVKTHEGLGIIEVYGRLVGLFMGHAYTNVLAPIWKAFPTLEPAEMKTPYVEPAPALTKKSQEALKEFIAEARSALEFTQKSVPASEVGRTFSYGGLTELEEALTKIEDFLARPRFRDTDDQA
jgi:hypothetical protein